MELGIRYEVYKIISRTAIVIYAKVYLGFTDITTALTADRLLFSSKTHLKSFLSSLPGFMGMMREYRPSWVIDQIRSKAAYLYPGCNYPSGPANLRPWNREKPPLIIWNHRWEFDKRPENFFAAIEAVLSLGYEFRLALLGENYEVVPEPFLTAREKLGNRVVQYGYEPSKKKYREWLRQGVIVVSAAIQENFGISLLEAIRHGCYPLLPNNLVYPELIPQEHHDDCLYSSREELVEKLCLILTNPGQHLDKSEDLAGHMEQYSWELVIDKYDNELDLLAGVKSKSK